MARKAGRSPEETRRALLDAAAVVIRTRGITASLDEIAREAGVSKGGLLYHFPAKEDLVNALAEDLMGSFRAEVAAAVDPTDQSPGTLTRAYIHTCLAAQFDDAVLRDNVALVIQLSTLPEIVDMARVEADRWKDELRADGLPDHIVALVIAAADGASTAPLWGGSMLPVDTHQLHRQLHQLTLDQDLWERLEPDAGHGELDRHT